VNARTERWRQAGLIAVGLGGLLLLWELLVRWLAIKPYILPAPSTIPAEMAKRWPTVVSGTLYTGEAMLVGFGVAVVIGVALAVVVAFSSRREALVYPVVLFLQIVPKIAVAPLFLIWIGYGPKSNILVAAIVAFFPMVVNTATGLESVEPDLLQLTHALRASPLKVFWKVRLPWALPHIFSGMKVAMSLSVIGAVVGEFVGSDRGLGYLILTASSNMNTAIVFGVMAVLSALGIVVFWAVCVAEGLVCPWYLPTEDARH
jgi:NitT/TauT family transport system permease protein